MIEDGKGQPTPRRWKRLRVGNLGDGPFHQGRSDALALRPDKRLRDAGPDEWDAKRSASGSMGKASENLQSSFSRLGVG